MESFIQDIIKEKGTGKDAVIPILQSIQKELNYLPEDMLEKVCELTEITPAEILGVASFYAQFRFKPAGKHKVKVCVGTACHVKGSGLVYDALKRELHLTGEEDTDADGTFTLEKVSCLGCCSLAPAVQIDNTTYGHVTPISASKILLDFVERQNNKKDNPVFITDQQATIGEIRIGLGSCCVASGSDEIRQAIEETISSDHLNLHIKHVGCVGMCHQVPLIEVVEPDKPPYLYAKVKPEDIRFIVEKHFKPKGFFRQLKGNIMKLTETIQHDDRWDGVEKYGIDIREKQVAAFLGDQIPIATEHRGVINPSDLEEYKFRGGFLGLKKALKMSPQDIVQDIIASGIRGRGGGGFPTGIKWKTVAAQQSEEKYLI